MTKAVKSLSPLTYSSWRSMHSRVSLRSRGYESTSICDRWKSFDCFLEDMGHRPSIQMTLDRIDASGNYEPGNCRWATWTQQAFNKKSTQVVCVDGVSMTIMEWSRKTGVSASTMYARINKGWTKELAVTTPRSSNKAKTIKRRSPSQVLSEVSGNCGNPISGWTREQCISLLASKAIDHGIEWKDLAASVGVSSAYLSEIVNGRKKSIPASILAALGLEQRTLYIKAVKP